MPKGIMLTPEEQAQRREEIVQIALSLIADNGFQKTSMREIAVLANMGKSSLYDFFKTKDEIVVYGVEKKIQEMILSVQKIIAEESSPEQCLRKIMKNHLDVPKRYQTALMWLNTASEYLEEEYQKRLKAVRYAYQDTIKSVIEKGMDAGVFRQTDAALMTRLLINSVLAIAYTSRPSASLKNMLDETMNIFLYGVMNDGGD